MPPATYTAPEAARLLGISRQRVYQLLDAAKISARAGRRRVLTEADLEALLALPRTNGRPLDPNPTADTLRKRRQYERERQAKLPGRPPSF